MGMRGLAAAVCNRTAAGLAVAPSAGAAVMFKTGARAADERWQVL